MERANSEPKLDRIRQTWKFSLPRAIGHWACTSAGIGAKSLPRTNKERKTKAGVKVVELSESVRKGRGQHHVDSAKRGLSHIQRRITQETACCLVHHLVLDSAVVKDGNGPS